MNARKKILAFYFSLQAVLISGCGMTVSEGSHDIYFEAGEHKVVKIQRDLSLFWGKDGRFFLQAPAGYKIIDYDYDKTDGFEFNDFVYVNDGKVFAEDSNDLGNPLEDDEIVDNFYPAGKHVIADVKHSFDFSWGKDDFKMDLSAPLGYGVLDYDYDKYESLEFETITYVNECDVKVSNKDDFGEPNMICDDVSRDYYEVGEHKIVTVNRNLGLFGKNETWSIVAPPGYKVIDYDYDKNEALEYETIVYENIVPVSKVKDDFGIPLVDVFTDSTSEYEPYQHVLVKVERGFGGYGFDGTFELQEVDGYEILDYDYDICNSIQFQTYVYANKEKVNVDDANDFGEVIKEGKVLSR